MLYRVNEHDEERASGAERMAWDREAFLEICGILDLGLEGEDIRFCRRVGERREGARPLIVGLFSEETKFKILRRAKRLEGTDYSDVSVAMDLTRCQREEEAGLQNEAARRNEELTDDELAKNVTWAVDGAKGEKRLIRTTARDQHARGAQSQRPRANMGGRGGRGRTTPHPPLNQTNSRGGTQPRTSRVYQQTWSDRGANYQPLGSRGRGGGGASARATEAEKRPRSVETEEEMEEPLSKK